MKDRIKELRKTLGLTQQEFADRIGINRGNVATYETREGNPGASVITLICREFNVNETWLRTGGGEMFVQQSNEDELADMVERLITGESAEFKRRLVRALSTLKEEHWILVEQKLKEIVGMRDSASAQESEHTPTIEEEARAEAEEYYRQLLAEKERASQASTVKESGLA